LLARGEKIHANLCRKLDRCVVSLASITMNTILPDNVTPSGMIRSSAAVSGNVHNMKIGPEDQIYTSMIHR
jgi:hypothetical protein